jgi:hypothetical protein
VRYLVICCLMLAGCSKGSGGAPDNTLSHPIVGSWKNVNWSFSFLPDRTLTEVHKFTGCTLTGSFTYDISGTTLTSVYVSLSKSNDSACETLCQNGYGGTCAASKDNLFYLATHSSATAAVSGSTLTIDGTYNFTKN